MKSTFFALLAAVIIIVSAALHVSSRYIIFLDFVAILLVVGGTITVAFITFPASDVLRLFKTSLIVMRRNVEDEPELAKEIIELARDTRGEISALQNKMDGVQDLFLKDAVGLVVDRLDANDIENILRDRIRMKQESDATAGNMLRSLAKYPPSLGIVGTVLGLIGIMQQLGGETGADKIGPAMAVGLVATLYGLVLTNFVLQPISENLALKSYKDLRKRQMVVIGILLIKAGRPPLVVQESVNSMLAIARRIDVLGLGSENSERDAA